MPRPARLATVASLAAVLLALAPPAAAQITAAQAAAQVKVAGQLQLAAFKSAVKDAQATLSGSLATLEANLPTGLTVGNVGDSMSTPMLLFLEAVDSARGAAINGLDGQVATSLSALAGGGDLAGIYPRDFLRGGGGVYDQARAALDKADEAARAAAAKRELKSAKKALAIDGVSVTFFARTPLPLHEAAANQGGSQPVTAGARIEWVLAASNTGVSGDGILFVVGQAEDSATSVSVELAGPTPSISLAQPPTDHFAVVFQAISEGGYVVSVLPGVSNTVTDAVEIGIP